MIYQAVSRWYAVRALTQTKPVGLVLHTSCVNYSLGHLKETAALPLYWILPEAVRWELRLLTRSKIFGRQAAFILERADKEIPSCLRGSRAAWNLEELYRTCRHHIDVGDIFEGTLLFAFGDLNKLDEFLSHIRPMPGHFVLLNSGWTCNKDTAAVYPLEKAAGFVSRKVRPLPAYTEVPALSDLTQIECRQTGQVFRGSDFQWTEKSGGNARIYTCSKLSNKYIKIFKDRAANGTNAMKLKKLTTLRPILGNVSMGLPEKLLVVEGEQMIGYTMMRCCGRPLCEFVINGWAGYDVNQVFRNLILLLLELHCLHIIVNDLSDNNVLVDEKNGVSLVDCDSFQVFHYPGGSITPIYRHPELSCQDLRCVLREPRHEYFAFAVLLFECMFYTEPLQESQVGQDKRMLSWETAGFLLDLHGQANGKVNSAVQKLWDGLDPDIKKVFADEFHFRSDNSFGIWIKALKLLE